MKLPDKFWCMVCLLSLPLFGLGQKTLIKDSSGSVWTVVAGEEYGTGKWHEMLWGEDYRKEWTVPVQIPVLNMDSAFGGLTPVKEGGGRQTKSLRLKDTLGRQFVLRSVDKTYTGALPDIAKGSFIETLANDQIATNHPYAALTVPMMAEAAGVYHTNPHYYVVPYSERLGEFNETFANTLCMLEERPDDTQTGQESFGHPEDIVSTEHMLEKITSEHDHLMDQHFYLKTRLFDIFLGDWGRHKDNWRWAKFDSGDLKIYRPVPKDRDQTYAKFEGFLLSIIAGAAGLKQLQSFDDKIKNIEWYNFPAIELDRRFTNQLTKEAWLDSAKALQQYLTDSVIETSVRQMPPQVFALSGNEIIRDLKQRRNDLVYYAGKYYEFLAKNVDIPGSQEKELFQVERQKDGSTSVTVYPVSKEGKVKKDPLYSRQFSDRETDEIRLHGIAGNDIYQVKGSADRAILLRIIGGPDKDSLTDNSSVTQGGHQTKYYDNPGNFTSTTGETKFYLSKDTSINHYDYEVVKYDSKGIIKAGGYNTFYRFYIGTGYSAKKNKWRKEPYAFQQSIGVNFSLTEISLNPYYNASFLQLIGNWNLNLALGYDAIRRINYFGIGNETPVLSPDHTYNWLRTHNYYSSIILDQTFRQHNNLALGFFYDGIKVIDNAARYVSKSSGVVDPSVFDWKHFGGGSLSYSYINVNNEIVPSKGINFQASAEHTMNLQEKRSYNNLKSSVGIYIPLAKDLSLAIKTGAATMSGQPEFYQLNTLGGYYTLRGYPRWRFYGKHMLYNQNELRWIPEVNNYLFNGKMGLVALFDQGRIWQPGEQSDRWHYGYGGGLVLVPFNKVSATITYSVSREDKVINLHFGKFF